MGQGWWFYFQLRFAGGNEEFRLEFMQELSHLIEHEGSINIYDGKDGKKQERISLRGMRS